MKSGLSCPLTFSRPTCARSTFVHYLLRSHLHQLNHLDPRLSSAGPSPEGNAVPVSEDRPRMSNSVDLGMQPDNETLQSSAWHY